MICAKGVPVKRSDERILTTHVGSLIRPKELLDLGKQAQDDAGRKAYAQALKEATAQVVRRQAAAGIDIVNDGEYGKSSWANYVLERMSGFEHRPGQRHEAVWLGRDRLRFAEFMKADFPRGVEGSPLDACVGPITYRGQESIARNALPT